MTVNNFQIDSASISDRGLSEKRPQNEDSFLELTERGCFVVADGVGGAQAGDVASQMAVEILGEAFTNLPKNGDAEELMKVAIERANEAIFQMSHDLASLATMATTIVALHVAGNIATIGHVGDSRLYRLDPKGSFYRETQDHSVVEEEVRAGRMTPTQAANHPSRNIISRALGAEHSVEVDMKTIMIEPNTTFLLCSDGITRHIDDYQLRELLLFKDSPANICRRMKEICYERGAEDNLTAVIAKITEIAVEEPLAVPFEKPVEIEEATVAAARPQSFAAPAAAPDFVEEETPTQPLVMPLTNDFTNPAVDETVAYEVQSSAASDSEIADQSARSSDYHDLESVQETSSGKMSRLLSSIIFLIVGGVLGAGVYYLLAANNRQSPVVQVPQVTQMQSLDIPFSSFEKLRRSVDNDPNAFINEYAKTTLDTESLYLLGRAYLLTGKFPEAKKYLEEAKNKLSQANAVNQRVLANDIALGLSIVDEAAAQNKFQSQIKPSAPTTQYNGNANLSVQ
ncbi:MAG: protein phosphatase 2C domain-containing protein [Pyrinomonadaceae bacterium]|nr:protein phosphatase 2C domain-containing protein [Pyrinomonadaceae bacterium]